MMPFNYTFRQMLLRCIRQLEAEKIDQYERKLARQERLRHEKNIIPRFCLHFFNFIEKDIDVIRPLDGPPFITVSTNTLRDVQSWLEKFERQYQRLINEQISNEKKDAAEIFRPYARCYNATHKLWVAQREYALAQGNFCQIPTTVKNIYEFIKKAINYRIVQLSTFFTLYCCRINSALDCTKKAVKEICKMFK